MFWNVRATPRASTSCGARPSSSLPWNVIEPECAGTSPVITLNRVDLPDPLGPITATTPPAGTLRSMLSSATRPPNFTVTPRMSSAPSPGSQRGMRSRCMKPPRVTSACCAENARAGTLRVAGINPSRRNSIMPMRMMPKNNCVHCTRSMPIRNRLPTASPSWCSHPVSCGRNQVCMSCSSTAPTTTPQTLPMPPSTTMTSSIDETLKLNISGVAVCSLATKNTPVMPAKAAPMAKASSLKRTGFTPIALAAVSSSRIAIQARPTRLSRSRVERKISSATRPRPT